MHAASERLVSRLPGRSSSSVGQGYTRRDKRSRVCVAVARISFRACLRAFLNLFSHSPAHRVSLCLSVRLPESLKRQTPAVIRDSIIVESGKREIAWQTSVPLQRQSLAHALIIPLPLLLPLPLQQHQSGTRAPDRKLTGEESPLRESSADAMSRKQDQQLKSGSTSSQREERRRRERGKGRSA